MDFLKKKLSLFQHIAVKSWKNAWAVAEEVCLRIDDSPGHEGIFQHFLSTDQKINFSTTMSILESPTIKRVLFRGVGIFPS